MSYGHGLQDWIPAASYCSSDSAFSEDDELSASVRTSAAIQYNELKGRDLARFKILTRVEDAGPKPGGSPEGLAPQISPQLVEEPQIKSYNLEIRRSRAMRCPKCHAQVASFRRWVLWPGPTRHCLNCAAKLRYVGFYLQVAGHAALGAIIVGLVYVLCAATAAPDWVFIPLTVLTLAVVSIFTAVLLPWRFARYKEIESR